MAVVGGSGVERVTTERLAALQRRVDHVRNICILAHVDHGKTTLSDSLIASNGLIHPKMAGKLRYLDSRDDEQERCITMKSSSISLLFRRPAGAPPKAGGATDMAVPSAGDEYLINLIDSPGHVDFCSEVSSAVRLSDGAIVVVDAVEGVCMQTHAVLRQAFSERLACCLVVNKLDRLILELRLTPHEALNRIRSILAEVNNVVHALRSERYMSKMDGASAVGQGLVGERREVTGQEAESADATDRVQERDAAPATTSSLSACSNGSGGRDADEPAAVGEEAEDDEDDAFSPAKGNVVFGSAVDGWAFRIEQFAAMYAAKMGASERALARGLWGDYFFHPKLKKIVGKKAAAAYTGKPLQPLFSQLCLEAVWRVYETVGDSSGGGGGGDGLAVEKMVKAMGVEVPPRDLHHSDRRVAVQAIMSRWLPLARAVLSTVTECLPDPAAGQRSRHGAFLPHASAVDSRAWPEELRRSMAAVDEAVLNCQARDGDPTVAFVSKMFAVPRSSLPRDMTDEEVDGDEVTAAAVGARGGAVDDAFIGFARVFSGVLRRGQLIHVLGPKYDPSRPEAHRAAHSSVARVSRIFLMMGRGLESLDEAPAGNIVGIAGLSGHVLKTATLSSTPWCRPFVGLSFQSSAIVMVAIEPARAEDLPQLKRGLQLLNKADPFVEVSVQETGEHVLRAAGEVHLERCLLDLRERFARVELEVSEPLVSFRETATAVSPWVEGGGGNLAGAGGGGPSRRYSLRVRAMPLPLDAAAALDTLAAPVRQALDARVFSGGPASSAEEAPGGEATGHAEAVREDGAVARSGSLASASIDVSAGETDPVGRLRARLTELSEREENAGLGEKLRRLWSLGPRRMGPNALLCQVTRAADAAGPAEDLAQGGGGGGGDGGDGGTVSGGSVAGGSSCGGEQSQLDVSVPGRPVASERLGLLPEPVKCEGEEPIMDPRVANIESSVVTGFQLAAASGPLCEETLYGVAFEVVVTLHGALAGDGGEEEHGAYVQGQIIADVRDACRRAMLVAAPRLVEAMCLCEVMTTADVLGKVYGVLGRRRSRIISEEMREGSGLFMVQANMPVAESFGFADEVRRQTSGAASPQLAMSHWEVMQEDPFFVPTTEEEVEEYGQGGVGIPQNIARKWMDRVRRRKGLPVEEKVVEHAEKQRTLARKV